MNKTVLHDSLENKVFLTSYTDAYLPSNQMDTDFFLLLLLLFIFQEDNLSCIFLLGQGEGAGQEGAWVLAVFITTYSRGKTDTSLLEYSRADSAGSCRIPTGAQPLFDKSCL